MEGYGALQVAGKDARLMSSFTAFQIAFFQILEGAESLKEMPNPCPVASLPTGWLSEVR